MAWSIWGDPIVSDRLEPLSHLRPEVVVRFHGGNNVSDLFERVHVATEVAAVDHLGGAYFGTSPGLPPAFSLHPAHLRHPKILVDLTAA
jgi:hypothetical protein